MSCSLKLNWLVFMFLNWSLLLYVVELEGFYQLPWHPVAQTIIRDDKWLFQSINPFHLLHLSLFLCKTPCVPETCAAPLLHKNDEIIN